MLLKKGKCLVPVLHQSHSRDRWRLGWVTRLGLGIFMEQGPVLEEDEFHADEMVFVDA